MPASLAALHRPMPRCQTASRRVWGPWLAHGNLCARRFFAPQSHLPHIENPNGPLPPRACSTQHGVAAPRPTNAYYVRLGHPTTLRRDVSLPMGLPLAPAMPLASQRGCTPRFTHMTSGVYCHRLETLRETTLRRRSDLRCLTPSIPPKRWPSAAKPVMSVRYAPALNPSTGGSLW